MFYREGKHLRRLLPVERAPRVQQRAAYPKGAIRAVNERCAEAGLSSATAYAVKHVLHSQLVQRRSEWLGEGGFVVLPAESRYVRSGPDLYRVGFASAQALPEGAEQVTGGTVERHGYQTDPRTAAADFDAAEEAGIIVRSEHDAARGRATGYRVASHVEESFLQSTADYMYRYPTSVTRYNLFDVEEQIRIARTPKRDIRTGDSGNAFPELVLRGMDAVEARPFNWVSVQREIGELHDRKESFERYVFAEAPAVAKLLTDHGIIGRKKGAGGDITEVREAVRKQFGEGSDEWQVLRQFERARGRWISALLAFESVKGQGPQEVDGGPLWRYTAAHEPTSTGRITERGGGFQNAPSEVMKASFEGVEGPVIDNDIESAHDTGLQRQFEKFGVDDGGYFAGFHGYEGGDVKEAGGDYVGVSRKTFKKVHHALKMQAAARGPFYAGGEKVTPSIFAYLRDEPDADYSPDVALKRFRKLTKRLRTALKEWRRKLEAHAWSTAHRNQHGTYFENAAGMRFPMHEHDDLEAEGEKLTAVGRRKLAGHVLQGMEAKFIHTLADVLSETDGVRVVANMHDGLITIGEVPESAVAEARRRTGYERVRMTACRLQT